MTRDEFIANAIALVGGGHGWQTRLSKRLDVADRTIRRAIKSGPSDNLAQLLLYVIGESAPQGVVAEWIEGDGDNGRTYLIHTRQPRFICEVRSTGDVDPNDDGVKYLNDEDMLCHFVWQDPMPTDLANLMERACDALDAIASHN